MKRAGFAFCVGIHLGTDEKKFLDELNCLW